MNLTELALHQWAKISKVALYDHVGVRLRDMGINPGREIKLMGKAPLGDPLLIKIGDTLIAIRRSEAEKILITKN